jgi:hypothetical protein
MINLKDAFDTTAASSYLRRKHGVHHAPSYLAKLRSVGNGPAFYVAAKAVLYLPSDLDAYASSLIRGPFEKASDARVRAA